VKTLKSPRNTYQEGSLRKVHRKSGDHVWEYRFRNHAESGSPMRQITLSVLEYPTTTQARLRLHEEVLRINGPDSFRAHVKPTMGVVINRFRTEERFEEIMKRPRVRSSSRMAFLTAQSPAIGNTWQNTSNLAGQKAFSRISNPLKWAIG
jgi:hypothetical protein